MAPRAGRNLVAKDVAILEGVAKLLAIDHGDMDSFAEYMDNVNARLNSYPNEDPKKAGFVLEGDEQKLNPEGDKIVKDMAANFAEKLDHIIQDREKNSASRATRLEVEILLNYKHNLENLSKGISVAQDKELAGIGERVVADYLPQMNSNALKPDQIENTSKALEQYPLDEYLRLGNELKEAEESLALNRDEMSHEEITSREGAIRGKKKEILTLAGELYEKSANPTEETLSLFGSKEYLTGDSGFMNNRGLKAMISRLELEEAKIEWNQKGIPEEMGLFSAESSNIVDIYGPNPKHHEAWASSKKVYEKDQFEQDLKSYDTEGLPFTDTELSMIGMAYTGLETEENIAARNQCPNPNGTDRENLENNTFWTSDLADNEVGPRANLVSYGPMLKAGREGAQKVARAYAEGDKKQLAQVIQNNFRIQQKSILKEGSIGTTSAGVTYLSQKTFLDMLDRDPELKQEFDAANQAVPKEDMVDLDRVRVQCETSKVALDKINANRELQRNPILPGERKRELQKKILTADLLSHMVHDEKMKASNHPDYIRKMNEQQKQLKELEKDPSRMGEYTVLMSRFLDEQNKQSEILPYLSAEEGKKRLDAFVDRMAESFGPSLLSSTKDNQAQYDRQQAEIQKLTLDLLKENNLAKLSSGQELTSEEKKQIVSDYVRQEIASECYDRFLKTGEKNRYLEMLGGAATEKEKNGILPYDDKLKGFVDNMGLENMKSEEIGEMLKVGAYREMTDKIAQSAELDFESKKKNAAPGLDDALEDLQAGKSAAWFGKEDYNNILSDLDKMNTAYRQHGKEIYENGTQAIDTELQKKQEELLARMDAYMARKETEFAQNKERGKRDNANSRMRYDAMSKAKKALQERMEYDKKINGLVNADREYKEYSVAVAERRGGELAAEQVPVQEQAHGQEKKTAEEVNPKKKEVSQLKKYNGEVKKFHEMSRKMLHDPAVDATVFGLNSWELQAAKVVAIAGIQSSLEQGKLQPNAIDQEMRKSVRKIGNSQEFKDWAKEAQMNPEKMKQLGKMAPEEVRKDFVTAMSRNMEKQNAGPKKEGPKKDGMSKDDAKKAEFKKTPPKIVDPVRQGP